MGLESFNPTPSSEEKPEEVTPEQPKTLDKWVENQLSELMMRRIAGEDVDLVKDMPPAPENLVKESESGTESEAEKTADDYIKLMRDALDHSDRKSQIRSS